MPAIAEEEENQFIFPGKSDYPTLVRTASKPYGFIPRGWKRVGIAEGDLNGDKHLDYVLAVKGDFARFKQSHKFLGQNPFDTNPRLLLVIFFDPQTKNFRLLEHSKFIPIPEFPTTEEPLEDLTIKKGIFKIHLALWQSAGSWSRTDTTYIFRYQNKRMMLIGADNIDYKRNTGEECSVSYNFLTGKVKETTSTPINDDERKTKVQWKTLKPMPLRALTSFARAWEWEVAPDQFL